MCEYFTVGVDEAILGYRTLRARSNERGTNPLRATLYGVFYCAPRKSSRTRTSSFQDIDFTAADILARVLARAGVSTRKCEVPSLPRPPRRADGRRQSRVRCQK